MTLSCSYIYSPERQPDICEASYLEDRSSRRLRALVRLRGRTGRWLCAAQHHSSSETRWERNREAEGGSGRDEGGPERRALIRLAALQCLTGNTRAGLKNSGGVIIFTGSMLTSIPSPLGSSPHLFVSFPELHSCLDFP